ncbi:MAG: response regulator [Chlorobi bacterium]|nr:response regulator [Chlorobiota bacterium]
MPNCKVLTALSGREGIKIAREEHPDTILLDIIMPGMDGYETCKRLKADESTKHIPVIMLTAIKTDIKSKVKGLDTGADAFFTKPIDAVELTAQLNVMLRIKEAEDKLQEEKKLLNY